MSVTEQSGAVVGGATTQQAQPRGMRIQDLLQAVTNSVQRRKCVDFNPTAMCDSNLKQFDRVDSWSDIATTIGSLDTISLSRGETEWVAPLLKDALVSAILDSQSCSCLMDPTDDKQAFHMVSDEFADLVGYSKEEIIGRSAHFLNQGCESDPEDVCRLRSAYQTGAPTLAVVTNRKASGEMFRQLLYVRGLTVASDVALPGEQQPWFLVSVHKDITDFECPPEMFQAEMEEAAEEILVGVARDLAELSIHQPKWLR
mmetsp:Transcript_58055/g.149461  ORF Transcript_58055/g.149461 Transcript_58055/m.149461 type:complete len:257 (+) Transcript_58055:126-896(+)